MNTPGSPALRLPPCRFGSFELHPDERRLLADGMPVALGARALDLLLVLVRHSGLLVSKDTLLAEAWPGLVVEENNLQVQVSTLRKVLGPLAIETVSGHGYRFTPATSRIEAGSSDLGAPSVHNLPQPLTSFIGHEDDLADYARILTESRLLTLTGIGGCGKTRLAIKLAEGVFPYFVGGLCFVDLAPILDGDRVANVVESRIKAAHAAGETAVDSICRRVANSPFLLVLDNCEHVLDSCAILVRELLERCPSLHVLATSREGLGVAGERIAAVRPLSLTSSSESSPSAQFEYSEAMRLFLDRARFVVPDMSLDEKRIESIAAICRRLDGIPLAIELAAARVKLLSVEQIQERLRDRFRLLVGGGKSVSRHRTLRSIVDWSFEQLLEPEQRLLRRLSVFVGGWSISGAAAMMSAVEDELQVLAPLERLLDVSLIVSQRNEIGEARYQMLETVRQYAEERLIDAGERDEARSRHLDYYLNIVERTPKRGGESRITWEEELKRYSLDRENFLVAHAWCDHAMDGAEKGLRLANGLRWFWFSSDAYESGEHSAARPVAIGIRILLDALARPGLDKQSLAGARAHLNVASMFRELGQPHSAKPFLDQGLVLAEGYGRQLTIANAHHSLAEYFRDVRDFAQATQHLENAKEIYVSEGKTSGLIGAKRELGMLLFLQGEYDAAEECILEGLALSKEKGAPWDVFYGHLHLSILECHRKAPVQAARKLQDALRSVSDLRSQALYGYALESAIGLAVLLGDNQRAARYFGALEAHRIRRRIDPEAPYETELQSTIEAARCATEEATFQCAVVVGRSLPLNDAIDDVSDWLPSIANVE